MTSQTQLDAQINAYLAEGPAEFPVEWREAIASVTEQTAQRRTSADWRAIFDRRWPRLAIVVVVIGLLAALAMPIVGRLQVEPMPNPTTGPLVVPSQSTILRWTEDALREPYPVPLRAEPAGGARVVEASDWVDPTDDGASGLDPRVDLVSIRFRQTIYGLCLHPDQLCVSYAPAQPLKRPFPEPEVEWISYGIVVDRDGDGSPDGQVGIDNIPGGCARAWYTVPVTEETKFYLGSRGSGCGSHDGAYGESEMPVAGAGTTGKGRGYLWISPGLAGSIDNRHGDFYLWAALIRDGQLVSVDYAPDEGWLTAPDDQVPRSPSP